MLKAIQLTPTAIFDLRASDVVFAKVVVLGRYEMGVETQVAYRTSNEHWFVNRGVESLAELLDGSESVTMSVYYRSDGEEPDPQFQEEVLAIEEGWLWYGLYARAALGDGHWTNGPLPDLGEVTPFLYVRDGDGDESKIIRLGVCVDPSEPELIAKLVWLTKDESVEWYDVANVDLNIADMADYSGEEYYHYIVGPEG